MENYSAELNSLMNRAPHGFMQLKLWDLFFPFYLLLCFERGGKMIFLFIILVSICRIKRDPLVFVAFNSVMWCQRVGAPFSQSPPIMGQDTCRTPVNTLCEFPRPEVNRAREKRGDICYSELILDIRVIQRAKQITIPPSHKFWNNSVIDDLEGLPWWLKWEWIQSVIQLTWEKEAPHNPGLGK